MSLRDVKTGLLLTLLMTGAANAQNLNDDFNRADNALVGNGWSEMESGSNVIEVKNNRLEVNTGGITNNDYIYKDVSGSYQTILDSNSTKMTWQFNMRQSRSDPSGFGSGSYGAAFVLAGSDTDFPNSGNGYAVVLGESGSNDELKIGRFSGGINGNTGIDQKIIGGNGPSNGFGNEYFAIKVTYDPVKQEWALYYHKDNSSFTLPQNVSNWQQIGSATSDNSYTGQSLPYYGAMFSHASGSTEKALFDNFSIPYPEVNFKSTVNNVKENGSSIDLTVLSTNTGSSIGTDVQPADARSTANNGSDVQQFSTTNLDFSGAQSRNFTITPTDDNQCEGAEYLTFELNNINGARAGANDTLRLYLEDDDHHLGGLLKTDFEGGALPQFWQNSGDWKLNNNAVINGDGDLSHKDLGRDGQSHIYAELPAINLKADSTTWQMNLEKDAGAPSTNNRFWFYLLANESNLGSNTVDGYAVGVNLDGNNDELRLWRVENGNAEEVLAKSSSAIWGTSDPIGIRVTRTAGGKWDLWFDDDGNGAFDNLTHAGSAKDKIYQFTDYCGLYTEFTASRTGVLQLDDLEILQNTCKTSYSWDGAGSSQNWMEGKNWSGNLAPLHSGSSVTLDNGQVNQDYQVTIPAVDEVTGNFVDETGIQALKVQPGQNQKIDVKRKQGSKFKLTTGNIALLLENGATYEDQSDDGFPSLPNNGEIKVDSGGEFFINNQSSFSTAGLQDALSANSDPGGILTIQSAGQALSASGKTYPLTLKLEGSGNSTTYTTAGSNPFTVEGNFVVGNNVTYQSNMGGDLLVNGNIDNQGSFQFNGNQKMILSGNDRQVLQGNLSVNVLEVDNANHAELGGPLTVNDKLIFTNGHLDLANHDLTMNGQITGKGAGNYLRTSGTGKVKKSLGTTADTFPIGYNPYLPVNIQCNDCSSEVDFEVRVIEGFYNDPENQSGLQSSNVVGYTWEITPSSSVNDVDVTVQWPQSAEKTGFSHSSAYFGQWESNSNNQWDNVATNVSGSDPYEAERQTMSFSTNAQYVGIGDDNSPLPVELIDFNASAKNGKVKLSWKTASELNNSHFEVQRMVTDGNWVTWDTVEGQGTTTEMQAYQSWDPSPAEGVNYYRLKQVDEDGSSDFSDIRSVRLEDEEASLLTVVRKNGTPYWQATVDEPQEVDLSLMGMTGKVIRESRVIIEPGAGKQPIPRWDDLQPGIYFLHVQSGQTIETQRILKRH